MKEQHKSLGNVLTTFVIVELSTIPMLLLSAIPLFVRITFIETTPPETQLSTCSGIAYCDKMRKATAKVRWYNAKHRERMYAYFQEKYYM